MQPELPSTPFSLPPALPRSVTDQIQSGARSLKLLIFLAGVEGLEPPTPGFGDRCSGQLSYTPFQMT